MDRLFLFCIGGTGSRVLRSLVHLLAAGVELPVRELIPIIIDPDKENGNVEQSIKLLNAYQEIRDKAHSAGSSFFKTSIRRLSEVVDGDIAGLSNEFRAGAQTASAKPSKTFWSLTAWMRPLVLCFSSCIASGIICSRTSVLALRAIRIWGP